MRRYLTLAFAIKYRPVSAGGLAHYLYHRFSSSNGNGNKQPATIFYWTFITCRRPRLSVLQAAGGALSVNSSGSSEAGVKLALAGLSIQIIVLSVSVCFSGTIFFGLFKNKEFVFFGLTTLDGTEL